MEHVYDPFLALMPPAGRILDAGCGSGRDAIAFVKRGFEVTAFDGSVELARLASDRTGLSILHLTFDEIAWRDEFDGVWACASLLHLPSRELQAALQRLVHALRLGGVLYVSMKAGQSEGEREGRWFTDATPSTFRPCWRALINWMCSRCGRRRTPARARLRTGQTPWRGEGRRLECLAHRGRGSAARTASDRLRSARRSAQPRSAARDSPERAPGGQRANDTCAIGRDPR